VKNMIETFDINDVDAVNMFDYYTKEELED